MRLALTIVSVHAFRPVDHARVFDVLVLSGFQ